MNLTSFLGDSLIDLKPEDLDALGIQKLGHKKKIMMEIRGNSAGLESSQSRSESVRAKGQSDILTSSSDAPDVISIKVHFQHYSLYLYLFYLISTV